MTTLIVGIVCFCAGLMSGMVTMCLVSTDRVNRERKDNTYDRDYDE